MKTDPVADCIVIGAGISGLLAARTLRDSGKTVVILDKARGVGGRMATRRIGECVFDHGAQFFTATDPKFVEHVNRWTDDGIAAQWSRG
ncbi:MAG: FAD-dependent oxidoreductase, partial [Candidatus Hydrogenedentales bacterium]